MPKITPDELAKLKSQHGEDITRLTSPSFPGHDFVFRRCGEAEFDALAVASGSDDAVMAVSAPKQLTEDLLLYPSKADWRAFREQYPGAASTFGKKLSQLAGLGVDIVVGKD